MIERVTIDDAMPWLDRSDAAWLDVEPVEFDLSAGVGFVQSHVSIRGLVRHVKRGRPGHDPADVSVRVAIVDGFPWIVDGAHRATVALIRGERKLLARVRVWPWE